MSQKELAPMTVDYSLVCLLSGEKTSLGAVAKGKKTVIGFWTTVCPRCPRSLDVIEGFAAAQAYRPVEFMTVCCDDEVYGRHMVLQSFSVSNPEHRRVSHFFAPAPVKVSLKSLFGFESVPYYVMLDEGGQVIYSGPSLYVDVLHRLAESSVLAS